MENLEQRHRERTGDQLPKHMRLPILLSICTTDPEIELTAHQHLSPDYAQMRAHIVTVINSRTRILPPMMMGNLHAKASNHDAGSDELVESEDGELYRLDIRIGRKVFTKHRYDSSKGITNGGRESNTDKECFRCGRAGHTRADCRATSHVHGGPPKSAPKGKGVGNCEEEEQESSQNVPLGIVDLESFEVLSDHGETMADDDVVESSEESTGTMPPLPPVSWLKERRMSRYAEMLCRKFRKHGKGNDCRDGEESSFFDCWDWRHEQSDMLKYADPWEQNEPKTAASAKDCQSVNFLILFCVSEIGRIHSTFAKYSSPVRHPQ